MQPANSLTASDVREIAAYTKIRLTDTEIKSMTVDLNSIIASLKPITEYDLTAVEPTYHPIAGLANVMREDIEKPGLSQKEALANAATTENGQFKVPPILGDNVGGH